MILHTTIIILSLLPLFSASPQNSSKPSLHKAKRTLSDQIYNHGDAKAVLFYSENSQGGDIPELQAAASSPALRNFYQAPNKPLALVSVQQPIQVFEQGNPKQVAEQQVLYEFQQTPTNAVSNVHVKQLFQPSNEITTHHPLYQSQPSGQYPTTQPLGSIHPSAPIITANQPYSRTQTPAIGFTGTSSNSPTTSATNVSPVHHNLFTNHGLNPASFSYHNPVLPEPYQFQNTQIAPKASPGKYIYLNGKIVYNPVHIIPQGRLPPNSIYHKGVYHNQQKLPLVNYVQKHNLPVPPQAPPFTHFAANVGVPQVQHGIRPQGKSTPPAYLPPITQNRFQAPKQLFQINKPSAPVQQEEADEEEDAPAEEEEEDAKEDDDEEEEDAASENKKDEKEEKEDEEDDSYKFETFPFEDDDYLDEDENHYFKSPEDRNNKSRDRERDEESEHDLDDDREDAKRGASRQYSKYHRYPSQSRRYRNSPKFENGENFGYFEGYSTDMKYKTSKKNGKNGKKGKHVKPVGKYRKVKFSKINGGKPKIEKIEGRFSENIPITHKHKVYKERWYVTKDLEGAASSNIKKIH